MLTAASRLVTIGRTIYVMSGHLQPDILRNTYQEPAANASLKKYIFLLVYG
jgi:hypothetical protein